LATYSHSRLKTHSQCPRKFLWRYVWNVQPEAEGVEAFVGKRVHETLEDLYLRIGRGDPAPDLHELVQDFQRRWEDQWSANVRIVKEHAADHYRNQGAEHLERYYHRNYPFDAGTTLAVEKPFQFPVEPGSRHRIRGVIDRIDLAPDGALEVHDYKTGRPQSARDLETDQQVGFYEVAARYLYREYRRVRLIWHFLRSGRERQVAPRPPGALAALRRGAQQRIERIEAAVRGYLAGLGVTAARAFVRANRGAQTHVPPEAMRPAEEFPARVGPLCRWCNLVDWCEEGSAHAGLPFRPPARPQPEPRPAAPPAAHGPTGEQWQLF
jgi:putative RecB family exonuclease